MVIPSRVIWNGGSNCPFQRLVPLVPLMSIRDRMQNLLNFTDVKTGDGAKCKPVQSENKIAVFVIMQIGWLEEIKRYHRLKGTTLLT